MKTREVLVIGMRNSTKYLIYKSLIRNTHPTSNIIETMSVQRDISLNNSNNSWDSKRREMLSWNLKEYY